MRRSSPLLRKPDTAYEILEAGVRPQRIIDWIDFQRAQVARVLCIGFFQPSKSLVRLTVHGFDPPTCSAFLRKVRAALNPGGRAAIAEFVPNPDRVSPPYAAAFSLLMLVATPSGDAYTFLELESISKDAGFARVELAAPEIGRNRLVVAYR